MSEVKEVADLNDPLAGEKQTLDEVRCRELLRSLHEGFFVGEIVRGDNGETMDFVFLEINAAFTHQTGLSGHAVVGKRATQAVPGLQRDIIETYARVVESGQPIAFDVDIPALQHRSYEARAHPVGGERFAVLFLEITERKRIEKALADSRAMLSDIIEKVDQIIWSARPDGYIDFFNGRWYEFTGAEPGASQGDSWAELLQAEDRARTFERWRHSLTTGDPYEIEYRALHRSGEYRWLLGRAHPVRNERGEIIRWMGTCTDIDQTKRAEAKLRESEEQFRTMAESLPQLAWIADGTGSISWYNRRWYEYTGTTLEEVQGWGWRKVHHPDHVDRVVERIQESWDTGRPWEDIFPLRGADGQYRWFLSRATPLRDASGQVTRWFGTNTDITEKQNLEEYQGLLIRETSHRVKNSLALVSALLNLQGRTLEGAARGAVQEAALRVNAVATVHDQLFRQSDAREIALDAFLSNLAGALATTAPGHDTIVAMEPVSVSADAAVPIGLLVNELVTNAYKYAYPRGQKGEVRIAGEYTPDGQYMLAVSDAGVGLPEGFDLRARGGSLGMRVITKLAQQLDGRLTVESSSPGTRFTITIPSSRIPRRGNSSTSRVLGTGGSDVDMLFSSCRKKSHVEP